MLTYQKIHDKFIEEHSPNAANIEANPHVHSIHVRVSIFCSSTIEHLKFHLEHFFVNCSQDL